MITPKVVKLIKRSQVQTIDYKLEQFHEGSRLFFLSRRIDGVYEVKIVNVDELTQFFEALE